MATHIYANLAPLGWVDLTDDPEAVVSMHREQPYTWWKDGGYLDSLEMKTLPGELEAYPFVHLSYKGVDYRVSPFDFQIVTTAD